MSLGDPSNMKSTALKHLHILYVLHTGIQWDQLKTKRNELHYTNVYKWHNRWSKNGSYQTLFNASIIQLHQSSPYAAGDLSQSPQCQDADRDCSDVPLV